MRRVFEFIAGIFFFFLFFLKAFIELITQLIVIVIVALKAMLVVIFNFCIGDVFLNNDEKENI